MIQILAVYSNAGPNWKAGVSSVCQKHEIQHVTNIEDLCCYFLRQDWDKLDKDCDLQIVYRPIPNDNDLLINAKIWGWECKATDLHASQVGGDVSFEDEIIQHLVRNQSLTRYGAIVAGTQEVKDLEMFTGMCSKHGVNWNWCNTIEKAVEKCFWLVEHSDEVIDCRKPIYINKDKDVPQFALMLAQFWKMTGDRALQIYDEIKEKKLAPTEAFELVQFYISDENLRRLWTEWWNCGIEPKKNLLKDPNPKVKKTSRKDLE